MTEPQIFMLGPDGWEETPEQCERRMGQPIDPALAETAVEIAPGVRAVLLSTGGGIGPDGQVRTFGARIAVWSRP
jgi:hypothetical protein